MIRVIAYRLLQTVPTLFGVTLIVFIIVRLTGDPATTMLPPETPPEAVHRFRVQYGLDKPIVVQYLYFLKGMVTGDLGRSIRYQEPVTALIGDRLPATLQLAVAAMCIALVVGMVLGILAGIFQGGRIDSIARLIALGGQAIPTFYLGILLILVFGVWLRVLPTIGNVGPSSLILPSVTLATYLTPMVLRVTRGSILDQLNQNYVRTARSKGMSERRVVGVHLLKSALIPVVTVVGLQIGAALGGAVITETVFAWPGLGQLLVNAISTRDFPVVQGLVLFAAAVFIFVNLAVDLTYRVLDPRIRLR